MKDGREVIVRGKDPLAAARALGERRVYVIAGTPKGHPQTHHIVEMTVSDLPEWDALMAALESASPPQWTLVPQDAHNAPLPKDAYAAPPAPATGAEREPQWHFRGCSQLAGHEGECVVPAPRPGPHPERVAALERLARVADRAVDFMPEGQPETREMRKALAALAADKEAKG